jgi:hypothetical protein
LFFVDSGEKPSAMLYFCKLSSDQRSILFDPYESESGSLRSGSAGEILPVEIGRIQYTEILCTPDEDKKGEWPDFFPEQVLNAR